MRREDDAWSDELKDWVITASAMDSDLKAIKKHHAAVVYMPDFCRQVIRYGVQMAPVAATGCIMPPSPLPKSSSSEFSFG